MPDRPNGALSERKLVQTLTDDDAAYNMLAAKHNTLVDHLAKFCQ